MKKSEKVEFTAAKFAALVGMDRHGLQTRLEAAGAKPTGVSPQGAKQYTLRVLVRAFAGGDHEDARLRKTREEADKLALQNARARGELVEVAMVKKLGEKVMIAIRNRILNMPMTADEKDSCLIELMNLGKLDWSRED